MQDTILSQNVWISASAGSGKTKVLIDRFLMLLLDGTSPTKILCITFTKAAAAEMLQRITDELTIWAICDESELIDRLTRLIGEAPRQEMINLARNCFEKFIEARGEIHISTIHSFCQKLIERFPTECNLEPGYRVADDQLIKTIIAEAKTSLLNDSAAFLDESIQHLFSDLSESKLSGLIDKIVAIHALAPNFFMTKDKFKLYTEGLRTELKVPEDYNPELEIKSLNDGIKKKLEVATEAQIIATGWLSQLATKSSKEALVYLKSLFLTEKNTPRIRVLSKQELNPEAQLLVSEIQSLLLAYLNTEAAYKIHRQTLSFFSLGNFFMSHYIDVKNKHAVLDYGDIVYRGVALLRNGEASAWFLYHLNNRFHHLLVDEAQDLNKTQWELILILSNEFFCNIEPDESKSIFVVGDPKQSIYSFQGASPLLFTNTREEIQRLAERYKLELVRSELNESFRSDPMILEFVDRVFRIVRERNPEYFVEESKHTSNKRFEASSIELWPLVSAKKDEVDEGSKASWQALIEYKELESPSRILAKKIAVRIKELLQSGYLPSDIMILVRKRDRFMEQLIIELKSENIPISGVDRLVLTKSLAIQDLLALGRFVLSQYDDYNLACLLKSPIFSVTEEELFELCNRGDVSLWESLSNRPAYKEIHALLMSLLENKNNHKPYQFFAHLLEVLQFRTKFLSRFGLQLNEILDEFLNLCLEFESTQSTSLSLFIDWFAKTELEIKRDSYANSNEVRLMTVHASKGLQAKVVILPDTTSVPKYTKDGILYNAAIRKLIAYQGASDHEYIKGLLQITELQTLQEYYRLLYVALTRASEKLILCGWSNTKKVNPDSWYALLEEASPTHSSLRGA